ncbi:MAG: tetratricopeptide repeat protein [Chloroflexi bacterium]|jgi:tetratricopeptide (TPR) repeat protein|nr:tetratricopeptide repeat protein [Chloroflexota bacterium]
MALEAQTWGDLLRQRSSHLFVGREQEQETFRLNFIYAVPKFLLFAIHGEPGVGKSALMARFRRITQEHDGLTAWVNSTQLGPTPRETQLRTMRAIARQFARVDTPLLPFEDGYAEYETALESVAADAAPPIPHLNLLHTLTSGADAPADAAWRTYVAEKFSNPNLRALIETPVQALSRPFVEALNFRAPTRPLLLCFDDWEQTGAHLSDWLLELLAGGKLHVNVWIALAGETPLEAIWEPLRPVVAPMPLAPLTEEETRRYARAKSITEASRLSDIWTFSKGLPIWLQVLTSVQRGHGGDLALGPVERYLKWMDVPHRSEIVLRCAAARWLDAEIAAAAIQSEDEAEHFEWLCSTPLLERRNGHWQYHPLLREKILSFAHQQFAEELRATHRRLYDFYRRRAEAEVSGASVAHALHNPAWRADKLEALYHGLMLDDEAVIEEGGEIFLIALESYAPFAGAIVATWQEVADSPMTPSRIIEWERTLATSWGALRGENWEEILAFCNIVRQRNDVGPEAMDVVAQLHARAERELGLELAPRPTSTPPETDVGRDGIPTRRIANPPYAEETKVLEEPPQEQEKEAEEEADVDRAVEPDGISKETEEAASPSEATDEETEIEPELEAPTPPTPPSSESEPPAEEVEEEAVEDTPEATESEVEAAEETDEVSPEASTSEKTEDAEVYRERGNAHFMKRAYKQAIEAYSRALEVNPQDAVAYNNRGLCYAQLKGFDRAIENYTRAIEIHPRYASAYKNRAWIYARQRNYTQAQADYSRALEINPQDAKAYNDRGNIHIQLEAYDQAIDDYTEAIRCNAQYAVAHLNRGQALMHQSAYEKAIADFDQALALPQNKADAVAYHFRGRAYAQLGQPEQALADYEQALEERPTYAPIHNDYGLAYVQLEQYDAALAAYQMAIEHNPQFAPAYYNAACAAALTQDAKAACDWLKRAIDEHPKYRSMARKDSDFDAIRARPCFQALL